MWNMWSGNQSSKSRAPLAEREEVGTSEDRAGVKCVTLEGAILITALEFMMATTVDASVKRRSLPPLHTSDADLSTSTPQRPKRRKKKPPEGNTETADLSDSHQSTTSKNRPLPPSSKDESPTMGSQERLVQNGRSSTGSNAKKPRRKKKLTHGYDFESGADDTGANNGISASTPAINNLKASPGSSRRKKEQRQSRLPRSVSDEALRDNATTSSTIKKKPPRRLQSKNNADDSADDEDDAITTRSYGRPPPPGKAKKKRKNKPPTSLDENYHADGEAMSLDIMIAAEDVIAPDKQNGNSKQQQQQQPSHTAILPSQPVGKLFMERKRGFKSEDKGKLALRRERELVQQPQTETRVTTTQVALSTHRASLTFGLFCHGLLAGFALWQCVMVYMLQRQVPSSDDLGRTRFLEHYSRLAQPASAMYYFLFTVCTVSVCDRFDVGRPDKQFFRGLITFQSGAISILIYLISLIMSASVAAIDDRINLFLKTTPPYCGENCPESGSLWDSNEADTQLNIWLIINLIRAIGACLGWAVISLTPTTDLTSDHLHDAEEPLWDEQQDVQLNNMHSSA